MAQASVPNTPGWRTAVLQGIGARSTKQNLLALDAWHLAEGGDASNNPFNTTQPAEGATVYNSVGVRNYLTPSQGIASTIKTLNNGRYGNVLEALRNGDDAMKVARAIENSPWGTGGGTVSVLSGGITPTPEDAGVESNPTDSASAPSPEPATPASRLAAGEKSGLLLTPSQIMNSARPSPFAVRTLSALGGATKSVLGAAQEPVAQTVTTLQTGSDNPKFSTLDLAQDFDGPVHPNAEPVLHMAMKFLGTPYLWGGADPRKGFDCSGFVQYLYGQAGIKLGRTTYDQVKQGEPIHDPADLKAGDIVFFQDPSGDVHHEGLYIGGGQFIHAPHTGDVVKVSSLDEPYYKQQFFVGRRVNANA